MRSKLFTNIAWFVMALILPALACAQTESGVPPTPQPSSEQSVQAAIATINAARTAPNNNLIEASPALQGSLVTIYQNANPGVVHVVTTFGSGSGFVYDEIGHIVTNNHVIEGDTAFELVFSNGERREAQLVGADSAADLATLLVSDGLPVGVKPLPLSDSNQIHVGQVVAAIGSPFGATGSMSMGIVSGLGRLLNASNTPYSLPEVIQTDAPINPGNSGGPLLNMDGHVIGVNSAIRSQTGVNSGVGFAIPVNAVRRIVPSLIAKGSYDYPYLGVQVNGAPITLDLQEDLGLPQTSGAYIQEVIAGSPADDAGLIGQRGPGGDLIVAIDEQTVIEFNDLLGYLVFETEVGQQVQLTVVRDGEERLIPVTLGARPSQ